LCGAKAKWADPGLSLGMEKEERVYSIPGMGVTNMFTPLSRTPKSLEAIPVGEECQRKKEKRRSKAPTLGEKKA